MLSIIERDIQNFFIPGGIMEPSVSIEGQSTPEIKVILAEALPQVIDNYQDLLRDEARAKQTDELGEKSKAELDEHLGELDTLRNFLKELSENPNAFEVRVQQISQDDGTFTAGLRRKADHPFGEGRENSQTQLRFYTRESAETEGEAIRSESLRGLRPEQVLRRITSRGWVGNITINTVSVYRGPTGRTMIDPQAGVRALLKPGLVEVYGLTYEGNTPHFTDQGDLVTPQGLGKQEYGALADFAKALSGFKGSLK